MARTPGLDSYLPANEHERLENWARVSNGRCGGPFYDVCREEWTATAGSGDRAVHVLRDPRERLIAWVFSATSANSCAPHLSTVRMPIATLTMRARVALAMVAANQVAIWMSRSLLEAGGSVGTVRYERLVTDPLAEFAAIFAFFGWNVSGTVLRSAIANAPPDERAAKMTWPHIFDRDLGQLFEEAFPGALVDLGYESNDAWFESLPDGPAIESDLIDELRDLRRRNRALEAGIAAQRQLLARFGRLAANATGG